MERLFARPESPSCQNPNSKMAYTSRTAAPAMACGRGSDAGMREAASKRPAAAAGLGDGDRPVRSPTAAAGPEEHGAPRVRAPPPPPTIDNNLKKDSGLRVLVFQAANGSKISGEADTEDYITMLRAQVELVAKNNGLDQWTAEDQKTEKYFDVRNAVHANNTGILVEFASQKMAHEIYTHYAQAALFLGFEHKVMPARDFYTELEPEMLREENPNLLILYLRNIPTVADVPAYQQQVAAHYKLADDKGKGRPVRTEILRTEICGEKTENRAGAVQFIFENSHNIKTYPVIDMLLDGNKIGTFSAACRRHVVRSPSRAWTSARTPPVRGHGQHAQDGLQGQGARGAEAAGPRVRQVQGLRQAPRRQPRAGPSSPDRLQAGRQGEVHELMQELQLQGRAVSERVHGLPLLRVARDHGDGARRHLLHRAARLLLAQAQVEGAGQGRQGEARAAARYGQRRRRRGDVRVCGAAPYSAKAL